MSGKLRSIAIIEFNDRWWSVGGVTGTEMNKEPCIDMQLKA